MAIELTDEEFDLLYRAMRATAEQTVDDDTRTLVELEDDLRSLDGAGRRQGSDPFTRTDTMPAATRWCRSTGACSS
jgi:hypothetical protein